MLAAPFVLSLLCSYGMLDAPLSFQVTVTCNDEAYVVRPVGLALVFYLADRWECSNAIPEPQKIIFFSFMYQVHRTKMVSTSDVCLSDKETEYLFDNFHSGMILAMC
jgi:hypothetical protein